MATEVIGESMLIVEPNLPWWKRALDVAVILMLAPGWVLISLAICVLIKAGSAGPVFFCQRRVGYRGREFICYKFRTMRVNAETDSHRNHTRELIKSQVPMTKLDARNDPRLIPFGALLRATGLDELPQLFNVIKGEMSLVGPRPCIPYEFELYEPWQRRRCNAVPGLTGLWQVSGKNRTTFEQMCRMDIAYSERVSLWLDVQIIFRTLPALLCQWRESRSQRRKEALCAPSGIEKTVQTYRV
jgi:lipopolysaccharide/colanic/teichoic acid biosynthesis glycosyltransferase